MYRRYFFCKPELRHATGERGCLSKWPRSLIWRRGLHRGIKNRVSSRAEGGYYLGAVWREVRVSGSRLGALDEQTASQGRHR